MQIMGYYCVPLSCDACCATLPKAQCSCLEQDKTIKINSLIDHLLQGWEFAASPGVSDLCAIFFHCKLIHPRPRLDVNIQCWVLGFPESLSQYRLPPRVLSKFQHNQSKSCPAQVPVPRVQSTVVLTTNSLQYLIHSFVHCWLNMFYLLTSLVFRPITGIHWVIFAPLEIKLSCSSSSGPCEIAEVGILWSHDTEIRKSAEGNRSRVCTRVQKPWSTTPALDRWHRRMDWDEDQRSGCSSGRSW